MKTNLRCVVAVCAIGVMFSAWCGYVRADSTTPVVAAGAIENKPLYGLLTTSGNNFIAVDGSDTASGMTIFSGTRLQTPENVAAVVQLNGLADLAMATDTSLTLTFTASKVDVIIDEGCATLKVSAGVVGLIRTAEEAMASKRPTRGKAVQQVAPLTPGTRCARAHKSKPQSSFFPFLFAPIGGGISTLATITPTIINQRFRPEPASGAFPPP